MGDGHFGHSCSFGSGQFNAAGSPRQAYTINEIRAALAKKHGATIACPMTTGIFSWVSANAAEEQREKGRSNMTPYWRTLKAGGLLNDKYPGGVATQKARLEAEGHVIVKKGAKYFVQNYEQALARF